MFNSCNNGCGIDDSLLFFFLLLVLLICNCNSGNGLLGCSETCR